MEQQGQLVSITVYATSMFKNATIELTRDGLSLRRQTADLSPDDIFQDTWDLAGQALTGCKLAVSDQAGQLLVEYTPARKELKPLPDPAEALPVPEALKTTEELYLAALHLEQYRHATFDPADYYLEGLRRDPRDIRLNNGYGLYLYRQGDFADSERYLRQAIRQQTWKNPNPYQGESYLNLGLVLLKLARESEAYDAFYKATWSGEVQSAAFYHLGCLCCKQQRLAQARQFAIQAVTSNAANWKAHTLLAAINRHLQAGGPDELETRHQQLSNQTELEQKLAGDPLDHGLLYEQGLARGDRSAWLKVMRQPAHNFLTLALDYLQMGFYTDALAILQACPDRSPLPEYYQAYIYTRLGQRDLAAARIARAEALPADYCFPNRLEEILILESAIQVNPQAGYAHYYLGNLYYDKKQHSRAIRHWEAASRMIPDFAITWRNLSLAYFNKGQDPQRARQMIERAVALNPADARLLLEQNQLLGQIGTANPERLALLTSRLDIVETRDDLFLAYITLLNCTGQYIQALQAIRNRRFHPWEGGEGKVSGQYIYALIEQARTELAQDRPAAAIDLLLATLSYPENLGEGKLPQTPDHMTHYYLGLAYQALGQAEKAQASFAAATEHLTEPGKMIYYNDQPADMILYQGLAFGQLGRPEQARSRYNRLISFGEKHLFDPVQPDYFAVSLPDTMMYQANIALRNEIYCNYLIALGKLGLGEISEAHERLVYVLSLAPDHQGALRHLAG